MEIRERIFYLTAVNGVITLFASIFLYFKIGVYALVFIPFAFLAIASAGLAHKHEYKLASLYSMVSGFVTFPFAGFLSIWAGFTSYRYQRAYNLKQLAEIGVKPALVNWIKQRLDKGYMEEYIREVLITNGYKKPVVDAAFRKITTG